MKANHSAHPQHIDRQHLRELPHLIVADEVAPFVIPGNGERIRRQGLRIDEAVLHRVRQQHEAVPVAAVDVDVDRIRITLLPLQQREARFQADAQVRHHRVRIDHVHGRDHAQVLSHRSCVRAGLLDARHEQSETVEDAAAHRCRGSPDARQVGKRGHRHLLGGIAQLALGVGNGLRVMLRRTLQLHDVGEHVRVGHDAVGFGLCQAQGHTVLAQPVAEVAQPDHAVRVGRRQIRDTHKLIRFGINKSVHGNPPAEAGHKLRPQLHAAASRTAPAGTKAGAWMCASRPEKRTGS